MFIVMSVYPLGKTHVTTTHDALSESQVTWSDKYYVKSWW